MFNDGDDKYDRSSETGGTSTQRGPATAPQVKILMNQAGDMKLVGYDAPVPIGWTVCTRDEIENVLSHLGATELRELITGFVVYTG